MVAGPIERASTFLPQFLEKKIFNPSLIYSGLRMVIWGLFKKLAIADNLGLATDAVFSLQNTSVDAISLSIGTVFFTIQIYADFSGYCDMAVGFATMLGFKLSRNFAVPYSAKSFKEFWGRWHITLSTWFRDYVYIPLGGNKKGNFKIYQFILITFGLSGLWHGADITFVIWGVLHGLLLCHEKLSKPKINALSHVTVILLVVLLWIPFRAENFAHLTSLLLGFSNYIPYSDSQIFIYFSTVSSLKMCFIAISVVVLFAVDSRLRDVDFGVWLVSKKPAFQLTLCYMLICLTLLLMNLKLEPDYIYFQF